MNYLSNEEGESFWVEPWQLLECPQVSDLSVRFNLLRLVSHVKIEFYGRVPLQIEHVAIDSFAWNGLLSVVIVIIIEMPRAE